MKQGSTLFLRGVVYLLGFIVLLLCAVFLPRAIASEMAGDFDYGPILVWLYMPAIPFFFALYQAIKLLGYIDANKAISQASVDAFKRIKYCGIAISGLFATIMPYTFYVADQDDAPGTVAVGLVIIFASLVIATFAGVLQKVLQNAVDIKSENDLTV